MTANGRLEQIGPRQRQILDVFFRLGEASVADIMENLPESPTAGAVRRMLKVLGAKGAVR